MTVYDRAHANQDVDSKEKAQLTPGFVTQFETDSVCLAPQESRNFDAVIVGRMFLLVIIGGDGRLGAAGRGTFLRLRLATTRHTANQATDPKARTAFGGLGGRRSIPRGLCLGNGATRRLLAFGQGRLQSGNRLGRRGTGCTGAWCDKACSIRKSNEDKSDS